MEDEHHWSAAVCHSATADGIMLLHQMETGWGEEDFLIFGFPYFIENTTENARAKWQD